MSTKTKHRYNSFHYYFFHIYTYYFGIILNSYLIVFIISNRCYQTKSPAHTEHRCNKPSATVFSHVLYINNFTHAP